jgi:hypothetical protein
VGGNKPDIGLHRRIAIGYSHRQGNQFEPALGYQATAGQKQGEDAQQGSAEHGARVHKVKSSCVKVDEKRVRLVPFIIARIDTEISFELSLLRGLIQVCA